MRMSTSKGWHGGHPGEAPKEELRHLTPKGTGGAHRSHPLDTSSFPWTRVCQSGSWAPCFHLNLGDHLVNITASVAPGSLHRCWLVFKKRTNTDA